MPKVEVDIKYKPIVVPMYDMPHKSFGVIVDEPNSVAAYVGIIVHCLHSCGDSHVSSVDDTGTYWRGKVGNGGGCQVELYPLGTKITITV